MGEHARPVPDDMLDAAIEDAERMPPERRASAFHADYIEALAARLASITSERDAAVAQHEADEQVIADLMADGRTLDDLAAERDALREALRAIIDVEWFDAALDPQRPIRIARAALGASEAPTEGQQP